tara:strand:+ start:699 stop:857 length:159 start_codon:yes stop_codon:yes gene_type:complete
MTDREEIIKIITKVGIEYEEWNKRTITVDDQSVQFHFNVDGKLIEIIGVDKK